MVMKSDQLPSDIRKASKYLVKMYVVNDPVDISFIPRHLKGDSYFVYEWKEEKE